MRRPWLLLLLPFLLGQSQAQQQGSAPQDAAKSRQERLLEIYTDEAARYTIYRDADHREKVALNREPVYVWTNPVRAGGRQDGSVFVWTWRGRPEVLGSIFSLPATGPRDLYHEFHSLSLAVLDVRRPGPHSWTPEAAGIALHLIEGAPPPAKLAPQRLLQMRELTREFSATTEDDKGTRWELRLLPRPLFRYQSTDPDVTDGALYTFVTSAGTDPQALLTIEARKPASDREAGWQFAIARFTDLNLRVRHKGTEVFTARSFPYGLARQDPKHRYRLIHDRTIPAVEDKVP
jgi:hypothetical protein